jgi:drug/metabolite transporter (DMT)-like permease
LYEGALLALATAVIWGSGDFLSRKPSSVIGSVLTSVLIQPVGLVIMIAILFAIGGENHLSTLFHAPGDLALNLGAGVVVFFGILFLFRGYAEGIMSIVAPIGGAYPIVGVTLSILLLGTAITPIRLLSIIAVIVGIILAGVKLSSLRPAQRNPGVSREKITRGADFGLGALICAGFGLFAAGVAAPVIGSILAVVVLKTSETLTASSLVALNKVKLVRPDRTTLLWVVVVAASDAIGFGTYNLAVSTSAAELPIAVTLSSLLGVVTVLLARIFYKEKIELVQVAGIVIIFAAVAALLYF